MEYTILEVSYLNKEPGGLCQLFKIPGDVLSVPSNKRISKRCRLRKWVWRPLNGRSFELICASQVLRSGKYFSAQYSF
jgi:hypothetical protein